MLSKTLLLLGVVATSYVSAAPTLSLRSPGSDWTISDFEATVNTTADTTHYTYSINENDGTPATSCDYTIPGDFDANYAGVLGCASPAYSLNQGWDSAESFATLVVTNLTSQFRAFYGWTAAQLDGQVQPDQTSASSSSGVTKRQGSGWTVQSFAWDSFAPTSSTYHFTVAGDGANFDCTISDAPASPQDDWDNVTCDEDDLHDISWGYSTQGFAVLTVRDNTVSPGFYALFGYSDVNTWTTGATPPDNGPQTVNEA